MAYILYGDEERGRTALQMMACMHFKILPVLAEDKKYSESVSFLKFLMFSK